MLSTGELASLLTGWMSLGYSIWSYTPQLILNFRTKPKTGGPTFTLLIVWLVGDGGTLAGLYIGGGLITQIVSAIWFAISDILLMGQMAYFRGYIPGTRRRRERKEEAHGAVGAVVTRAGIHRTRRHSQADLEGGAHELEIGKVSRKRQRRERRESRDHRRKRRDGFVELAPGKGDKPGWRKEGKEKKEREGCVETLFGRYNNVTQSLCLVIVTLIMICIWIGIDYLHRDTASAVSLAEPPTRDGKLVSFKLALGFALGWIGTLMYNAPRWYQLYWTIRSRSTAGVEPWLFATLLLQNFTLLASILSASHKGSYLYAQSPYLTNIGLAIFADIVFLVLHHLFKDNPAPKELDRPWTDPTYFNEKEPVLPTLAADRDMLQRGLLTRRRASYAEQSHSYANAHDKLPPPLQRSQADHLRTREKELRRASDRLDQHIAASKDHRRIRAHVEASASSGEEEERQMEEASRARRHAEREGARREWEKAYGSFGGSESGSGSELSGEENARRLMGRARAPARASSSSSRR